MQTYFHGYLKKECIFSDELNIRSTDTFHYIGHQRKKDFRISAKILFYNYLSVCRLLLGFHKEIVNGSHS